MKMLISEIFEFVRNGFNAKHQINGGGVPITRIETISDATINLAKVGYAGISKSEAEKYMLKDGDILFSHINSVSHIGKCAIYKREFGDLVHGMNLLCFRPNAEKINPNYALHLIRSNQFRVQLAKSIKKAVNQASVSTGDIKKIVLDVPSLEEQERISALLDTADSVTNLRDQSIKKLEKISNSILKNYLAESENIESIKTLGEICDVRDGTHASPKYVSDGIPLVTSKNLKNGFVDLSDVNLISNEDFCEINRRSKVDCGDILMPMIGTIGNPVVVEEVNPMYAIKNVALVKQLPCSPSPTYLKAFLESDEFRAYVAKVSRGGTQKFLGLGDIRALKIPLLKKDIENQFLELSKEINSLRKKYMAYSLRIDAVVSSLQHKSFAVN